MSADGTTANGFRLAGCISHVAAVNPTRGRKLWALYDRIAWPAPEEDPAGAAPV
jgi:hypothetical protein